MVGRRSLFPNRFFSIQLTGRIKFRLLAVELLREGIEKVPSANLFSLYQSCAEILERDGKAGKAVRMLREGIKVVPPKQNLSCLYLTATKILNNSENSVEALRWAKQEPSFVVLRWKKKLAQVRRKVRRTVGGVPCRAVRLAKTDLDRRP